VRRIEGVAESGSGDVRADYPALRLFGTGRTRTRQGRPEPPLSYFAPGSPSGRTAGGSETAVRNRLDDLDAEALAVGQVVADVLAHALAVDGGAQRGLGGVHVDGGAALLT